MPPLNKFASGFWQHLGAVRAQNALLMVVAVLLVAHLASPSSPRSASAQVGGGDQPDRPMGVRAVTESTSGINPGAQRVQMIQSLRTIEGRLGRIESKLGGELKVRISNPNAGSGDDR